MIFIAFHLEEVIFPNTKSKQLYVLSYLIFLFYGWLSVLKERNYTSHHNVTGVIYVYIYIFPVAN